MERKQWSSAVGRFNESLALNLQPYEARLSRAEAHAEMRDHPRALADCDAAARLRPSDPQHLLARAKILQRRGDYPGAVGCYERAVKLRPGESEYHNSLAWVLATYPVATARDGSRAVAEARTAIRLGGSGFKASYLDTLAAACAECGRFEEAVQHQTAAIASAGPYPDRSTEPGAGDYHSRLRLYRHQKPLHYER